ncbi:MAG: ATP-binding protein [Desulfobacterales bacterium]
MQIIRHKKLYLPAFSIIAVVLLLILLVAVLTYRTLDHQRKTALTFLHSQGVTLLHAMEAGAVTGMLMPMWNEDSVKTLIHIIGKNKNIAYIYIYDQSGAVIHASGIAEEETRAVWRPELKNDHQVVARLRTLDNGSQVYELAKRFSPELLVPSGKADHLMYHGSVSQFADHHAGNTVVLGMSMEEVESVHRSDVVHAVIMAAILLVLGSGAIFFTFVIQNYYLVDKALKQSRDYLQQVIASMANGMISIDNHGNVTSFNDMALDLLGLKETEVKNIELKSIIDFQSSGINETLNEGESFVEKEIVYNKGAEKVPLALSVSPIPDEKKQCAGAVIILRDLTEIKRLQEKVQRSERLAAIGELAAGVAHEVRNPLSSIRGFAQFLGHVLEDKPDEREYAEIMVKEVDRINNVVTNLLSFARPVKPDLVPTDLPKLLDHTVRLVEEDARLRKVNIRLSTSNGLKKIYVDGNQITQVMLNLILNALQAVDAGGNIKVEARMDDSDRLKLSVEDDGPGIPPGNANKIFDPFYTTREKGTGLGLAIVHMIVENHGGEINLVSPVPGKGKGCRITIDLLVSTDNSASHNGPQPSIPSQSGEMSREK